MKLRFLLFVCAISCICSNSYGQQVSAPTGRDTVYLGVFSEQLGIDILEQLKDIKEIQDSTYQQRMRAIEAREKDSHSPEAGQSEFGVMSEVEKNTRFNFFSNDFNAMGILAFIVACLSLWVAKITYDAQKRTEEHTQKTGKQTQNAPLSVQKSKLKDLPRHFYRNLVCSSAAIFKYKEDHHKRYPSESNLLKLQVLPDDIVMPIDVAEKSYGAMHELRLLFRNYNVEVSVASQHLSRKDITNESLVQDFDNLLFKPITLICNTFEYERALYEESKEPLGNQSSNSLITMIIEHFKKLQMAGNFGVLLIPEHMDYLRRLLANDCSFIRREIDQKNGISRALQKLLEEGSSHDQEKTDGIIDYSGPNSDSKSSFSAVVNKGLFINCIDNQGLKDFVSQLSDLVDPYFKNDAVYNLQQEWFGNFYRNFYDGKIRDPRATSSPVEVLNTLRPYLAFLHSDSWDVEGLINYMLAVDIAIEADRIGMVNYAE